MSPSDPVASGDDDGLRHDPDSGRPATGAADDPTSREAHQGIERAGTVERTEDNEVDTIALAPGGNDAQLLLAMGLRTAGRSGQSPGWQPPSPQELRQLLPHYEITELLGHGGMGAVYKGRQPALDRPVAVKILPLEFGSEEDFATRFTREARALALLQHPNIVSVFDFGKTGEGHLYYVMEFVEGRNLAVARREGRIEMAGVIEAVKQVCDALEYSHRKGILHRDIKPANVLIGSDGRVKLTDFGLAKMRPVDPAISTALTMPGQSMGTRDFAAPEQLSGSGPVDQRADIFSLGATVYYLLTGEVPMGALEPPSRRGAVDQRFDAVVMRALSHNPERRQSSVADFRGEWIRAHEAVLLATVAIPFEESWEDLMLFMEERMVVPVIGEDALIVAVNGRRVPLYRLLAERLAAALGVGVAGLPHDFTLNHVAGEYLSTGRPPHKIYTTLHQLAIDPALPVPDHLLQLARLKVFPLFVCTTFDHLMERALVQACGSVHPLVFSCLDRVACDLPAGTRNPEEPMLYHLFGQSRAMSGSYAVTDEDVIEFFCALNSDRRPARLFDELQGHHLLLLGTGFPDWLVRLFLRQAKGRPFSAPSPFGEVLAERRTAAESDMEFFFRHFSQKTLVFPQGDPEMFISELVRRWRERHPESPGPVVADRGPPWQNLPQVTTEMPPDAVFISAAEEDRSFAAELGRSLEEAGLPVWFDRTRLDGDVQRDAKIQRGLRQCALFVPVISPATEARDEGYFRREWKWACDRAESMYEPAQFVVAAARGSVGAEWARVPQLFRTSPWLPADNSAARQAFALYLQERFREHRRRRAR